MYIKIFIITFLISLINCRETENLFKKFNLLNEEMSIYANKIQNFLLHYQNESVFNFISNESIKKDLMVNIYSINCKIKIDFLNFGLDNIVINQMNNDTFSFLVNANQINTSKARVKSLINSIDERIEENLKYKTCPIIVTSYHIDKENIPNLTLNDSSNIYFDNNFKEIHFSYKINNSNLDTPIALFLSFNKKSQFNVSITESGNDNNEINKNILNSTFIFFGNEFKEGNQLNIKIRHINYTNPVFMNIKVIKNKNNSISVLEQNNLNFGFITSNIEYQYYYMEVFKDQEGEIMLHNKRQKGILFAYLVEKSKISDLNDTDNYPKIQSETDIEYNQHTLRLYFNNTKTSKCENGCYLLLSYYNEIYDYQDEDNNDIIGYEYTILSRIWDCIEFSPQIINIPFNEYIFGSFYTESITHHYYSIFIPNDAEKIIIQLEGNYLDGFLGEGIVKLNTMKTLNNVKNLNIIKKQNFIELTKGEIEKELKFDFRNKYISLAFRSKNFFEDIFSFYYFRIFYLKKEEALYYPVDSKFGNLCSPIKENNKYYCNLILKNDYNELSSNFSIAEANQIENSTIKVFTVYKNNTNNTNDYGNPSVFKYIYETNDDYKNISYFIFKFEFDEEGIKNIISAFSDKTKDNYPQIYSSEMYYIYNRTRNFNYALVNNYLLTTKWISGLDCHMKLNYSIEDITIQRNFRGKPVSIQISPDTKNMTYRGNESEFIFYLKLDYNMKNKGIEEIISGETKSHIISGGYFPLYYYLNLTKCQNINVDINIRLNSYNMELLKNYFEIRGYMVDKDTIERKTKGEYIELKEEDAIKGTFMECYKFGFLEININNLTDIKETNAFVLITITNNDKTRFDSDILVEIVNNEYKEERYFMPINQYIIETFDNGNGSYRNCNNYSIATNDIYNKTSNSILVEFSPNYEDLQLIFEESENASFNYTYFNLAGFRKYRIFINKTGIIRFSIKNPSNREKANYMLRYYYTEETLENKYNISNFTYNYKKTDSENALVNFTFNLFPSRNNEILWPNETETITFYIYAFLFKENEDKVENELVDTSTIIHNRNYTYKTENKSIYENWDKIITLTYEKVDYKISPLYKLQLRVNVFIENTIFNEEFLTYIFDLDLTDLNHDDDENNLSDTFTWVIIGFAILIVIIIIIVILLYKNRKLEKDKQNLEDRVLSIGYSAGIEKNILKKEEYSKKDDDYEKTFI